MSSEAPRWVRSPRLTQLSLVILLAAVPLRAAHAYVDPNTVGPLYQILFPLLLAITSTLTAFRRAISQTFRRLVRSCLTALSGARARKAASDRSS